MRKLLLLTLIHFCVFQNIIQAQTEKDVPSVISRVTVYPQGAQIEREASFDLKTGNMVLSFKNLSPYISKESIRIDGAANYTILNVQLENDYLNELEKKKDRLELDAQIQAYKEKTEDEETAIKILNEKLEFLKTNKEVTGKQQSITPEVFKSFSAIYNENYEKYSLEILKRQRLIRQYSKEIEKLNHQFIANNSKTDMPSGRINVTIDAKHNQATTMKLIYMVSNASWYPSYDIRFVNTNKPLTVSFKSNIKQNTGIDWKNVKIKLSTAKTNVSAQIPTLSTSQVEYDQSSISSALKGRAAGVSVTNSNEGALGSTRVMIRGAGSISNSEPLCVVDGVPGGNISQINPDDIESVNVLKDNAATSIYGSRAANGAVIVKTKKNKEKSMPQLITTKTETSSEFTIDAAQTVNADDKLNIVTFKEAELNATYEYEAIPKLSKNVYLIAKVTDWNKADLLDGEANVYLENSYVGKSSINTQQFSDTLDISFGVDNNITVNREKLKEFSESQFIGSNKKESLTWKITVRSNKSYPVKLKISDQVPVSTTKEIQVEVLELSGGSMNANTGKVQWIAELKPNETKQYLLKYTLKYPKDKKLGNDL